MTIHEVTDQHFAQHLEHEIEKVIEGHEVLRVKRSRGDFVILSDEDWRAIEETLHLNRVPGLVASLHEAAQEPVEDGVPVEDLDW